MDDLNIKKDGLVESNDFTSNEEIKDSKESKSKEVTTSDMNKKEDKPKSKLEATKDKIKEAMNEIMSQIIEVKESNDKQNITTQLLQTRTESIDKEEKNKEESNIDINEINESSCQDTMNNDKKKDIENPEQYIFKQAIINDDTFYYPYVGNFNDNSINDFNNQGTTAATTAEEEEEERRRREEEYEKKKKINPMDMYDLMNERNGLDKEKQKNEEEENHLAGRGIELMNKFYTEEERKKLNLMNTFPVINHHEESLNTTISGTDLMNKFYTEEERNTLLKPFTENFGDTTPLNNPSSSNDNINGIELDNNNNNLDKIETVSSVDKNNNSNENITTNKNLHSEKERNQMIQEDHEGKFNDSDSTSDSDREGKSLLTNLNDKELPLNETTINNDINSMLELFPSIVSEVDVYCQPALLEDEPVEEDDILKNSNKKNIMANPFSKESAKSKENIRNQEIVISDDEAKLVYRCHYPDCNKTFARLSYLLQHEFTHTGEMPYKCTKCDEQFFKKCDFKEHKKIHKLEARQARLAAIAERKKNRM